MNVKDEVRHVVDISPRKQRNFIPGTGHELVPPDALLEYRPDIIIVMNPIYIDEIRQIAKEMGLTPNFLTA